MRSRTLLPALGLIVLFSHAAAAQNGPVRLIVSNGMRTAVEELRPQCERAVGRPLEIQFGTTVPLMEKIAAGGTFDAVVLTAEAIGDLVREKKAVGPPAPLARCGVGVGTRAGAAKPDIHTPEALKRALLDAKSVAYAKDGASRGFIDGAFEKMGIAGAMKNRILLTQGSVAAGESVAAGQGGLVLTLVSEILPMKGIELVGPLPPQLQNYVNFAGAAGAHTAAPDAAAAVIRFFQSPAAAAVYKAKGLEPR